METPKELILQLEEIRICDKFNSFLYKNKECNEYFATNILKAEYDDRFIFVRKKNRLEREMAPIVHELFHGKYCVVKQHISRPGVKSGSTVIGHIEHPLTRTYGKDHKETSNDVSIRTGSDGKETIALWVNTGDKHTTHLYNLEDIELMEMQTL